MTNSTAPAYTEQELRDDAIGFYSDSYKDWSGIRPRHVNFDEMLTGEILAEAEQLNKWANDDYSLSVEEEAKAKAERSRVAKEVHIATHPTFASLFNA